MADVLDIQKWLNHCKQRIYRVGIELEGGWDKLPEGCTGLQHDGSVIIKQPGNAGQDIQYRLNPDGNYYRYNQHGMVDGRALTYQQANAEAALTQRVLIQVGEMKSPILDLSTWKTWTTKNYPHHVNETCGLHVHMSFRKAIHYERLMVPEYQSTIVAYLSKWAIDEKLPKTHPIWPRLEGKNKYCKLEFLADGQAKVTRKSYDQAGGNHRYTAINYPYNQHGTVECRLLPMLDTSDIAIRAIQQVLDVTNACLRLTNGKEKPVSAKFITDSLNDTLHERREEYV